MTLLRIALAGAVLLTACSDGRDADGGEADPAAAARTAQVEAAVTEVLQDAYTDTNAEQCDTLYTQEALDRVAGPAGGDREADLAVCGERMDALLDAQSAVVEVEVLGDGSAKAVVRPDGGEYAGLAAHLDMVEQDGWRIDRTTHYTVVDRAVANQAVGDAIQSGVGKFWDQQDADCIKRFVAGKTDAEYAQYVTDGKVSDLGAEGLVGCVGLGSERVAVSRITTYQLVANGIPQTEADCTGGRLMFRDFTVQKIMSDPAENRRWNLAIQEEAHLCVMGESVDLGGGD